MDIRWRAPDRRYSRGWRWTPAGRRARNKWIALVAGWFLLVMISGFFYDGGLIDLAATAGVVAYGLYRHGVNRHQLEETRAAEAPAPRHSAPRNPDTPPWTGWTFNPAPGWPCPRLAGLPRLAGSLTRHGPLLLRAGGCGCHRLPRAGSGTGMRSRPPRRVRVAHLASAIPGTSPRT